LTILLFAALLYRIERRPLVFGTLCLALASCLLLVPAQPYAGGLLSVNMAMLTARNLEYVVYIFGLVYVARQPIFNSWRFWVAVVCLGAVAASDRLFLDISLVGGLLAMITYGMRQRWKLVSLSVNWLLTSLVAGALGLAALWVIDAARVTQIVGQRGGSYMLVHGVKAVLLSVGYGLADLFTNFGANPAYDATMVHNLPSVLYHRLGSLSGVSYIINAVVLIYGLFICSRFLRAGLVKSRAAIKPSTSFRLTNMMIWVSLAAIGIFITTNHYYAVDSSYLTICLFAVFVALAAYSSKKRLQPGRLLSVAAILCLGMVAATPQLIHTQKSGQQALADIDTRNQLVAQSLQTHHIDTLVGDYWRVLPIKADAVQKQSLIAMPLSNCTQASIVSTSQAWQPNLHGRPFAYLLSFDKSLTDYPHCNLRQVTKIYGLPNSSELIAGTLEHPTELLLYYDRGLAKSSVAASAISTILPVTLDQLPGKTCNLPTQVSVVAHQDDDLLFMNPTILREIKAGHCVRTIYLTAGDDGHDRNYWLSREQGVEAAYSAMLGTHDFWTQRAVRLNDHEYVIVANPHMNTKISLVFLRLPDGNLAGQGFAATHNESLTRLYNGLNSTLHSVDEQSSYTTAELTDALNQLFLTYQPTTINAQATYGGAPAPDHSDHITAGKYAQRAYGIYESQRYENQVAVPVKYFVGYPIRQLPANLSDQDYGTKLMIFLSYAAHDRGVCHQSEHCQAGSYDDYLHREYERPN
jgi:LmbE family N-acetylglucosaminyl deacetylase